MERGKKMFKGMIKKRIKEAAMEAVKELLEVITTAEYSIDPQTKEFKIKLKKEW